MADPQETGVACPHCPPEAGCQILAQVKYVQKGRDMDMVIGPGGAESNYSQHVEFFGSYCQGLFRHPPQKPGMAGEILEAHRIKTRATRGPRW